MPIREIKLSDDTVIKRNITDVHPNGDKFLPEKFTIPADDERGSRIYDMLAEIIGSIAANKKSNYTPQVDPDAHGIS